MKFDVGDERVRGWLQFALVVVGTVVAAMTSYTAIETAKRAEARSEGYLVGKNEGHDAVQDAEIAALQATYDRDAVTIAAAAAFLRDWPDARRRLEDIHLFLVRRFQMPTALHQNETPEPYRGPGLYAAEDSEPRPEAKVP